MLYFAKRGMITASRFTSYLHFALCMCQPFTVCMHFSIYLESMLVPLHSNLAFPFMYGLAPHGWPQTSLQEISKINICTLFEHVSTTICGALARVLLKGPGLLMAKRIKPLFIQYLVFFLKESIRLPNQRVNACKTQMQDRVMTAKTSGREATEVVK